MTKEKAEQFEQLLIENGYKKYTSCLSSTEDYGYFKSCAVTYDNDGDKEIGYQIEFRFWDWTKYEKIGEYEIGIDIIFMTSTDKRTDLILTTNNFNIQQIEKVAEDFYHFVQAHQLI